MEKEKQRQHSKKGPDSPPLTINLSYYFEAVHHSSHITDNSSTALTIADKPLIPKDNLSQLKMARRQQLCAPETATTQFTVLYHYFSIFKHGKAPPFIYLE